MNPSTSGWITKLLKKLSENQEFIDQTEASLYGSLKHSGFIYGNNKSLIVDFIEAQDLSDEEISKINLFISSNYHFIYAKNKKYLQKKWS